jgi:hypothetical protein
MSITRPRTLTALALLSALALCAFAAPSVAQAANGTTAFTCVFEPLGQGDFGDAHCANPELFGHYTHQTIPVGQKTKYHVVSTIPSITFTGTIATIKVKITCTSKTGVGFITNEEPSPGNHTLKGEGIETRYTGCDLKIGKTETTCSVQGGEIVVPGLKSMDVENAHGFEMGIKFEPEKGTTLATFTAGSDCPSIGNQSFNITGSMLGVPHGATMEFTEASTKPTLSLGGNAVSLADTQTVGMLNEADETENPIAYTTTH